MIEPDKAIVICGYCEKSYFAPFDQEVFAARGWLLGGRYGRRLSIHIFRTDDSWLVCGDQKRRVMKVLDKHWEEAMLPGAPNKYLDYIEKENP